MLVGGRGRWERESRHHPMGGGRGKSEREEGCNMQQCLLSSFQTVVLSCCVPPRLRCSPSLAESTLPAAVRGRVNTELQNSAQQSQRHAARGNALANISQRHAASP